MHLARAHEGAEVFSATRRSTTKIAPENCRLRVGELAATRRAYARSAEEFLAWCASMGVSSIAGVRPVHAATWIEAATREPAAPRQRPIAPALVFEPLVAHEDGMGASAPLPHQGRAGRQHSAGIERTSAFLERSCQNPKAALQRPVRATAGALLQLISEPPDHQIATEAQGRSGVIQCKPSTPQLLCRSVD